MDRILTAPRKWSPISDPQAAALKTPAVELYYGGAAGGGKTDLLLGAPISDPGHQDSIIFRREYPQLKGIIKRSRELYSRYGRYNGSDKIWTLDKLPGRPLAYLEFGAVANDDDLEKFQGRANDLKGFDELPQFSQYQYMFLTGWLRSGIIGQRQRVIGAGNPPLTAEGEWVVVHWAPWLSNEHPNPAHPGELRWFAMIDDKDTELPPESNGESFLHKGERITPISRTFIPARIEDNPILMATNYKARLQMFPEPLRSQLLEGKFNVKRTIPNRVYWNFSEENLNSSIEYHRGRVLCVSLDFNVTPSTASFGHELEWGEYPPDHHEDGMPQFGFFGELYLEEDYDATKLAMLIATGKDINGKVPNGWRMPDSFKGLLAHRQRIMVYGDAAGGQKRIESEDNRTAWMYITSVFNANKIPYTLIVPEANPSVIHSAGVTNYKFRGLNGKISLWAHPRCKSIIRDANENVWRTIIKPNGEKALVIDKSNPALTHSMDNVRYLVMSRYRNSKAGPAGNPQSPAAWMQSLGDNLSSVPGLMLPGSTKLPWE